jgi:hypothetical protein
MRKTLLGLALLSAVALFSLGATRAADEEKAKFTIKEVMKQAHSGGNNSLLRKAAGANGTKEDKEKVVELYTALSKNKPGKGEEKSWKDKTEALLKGAQALAKGEAGAGQKLVMAANCKACHDLHRGQ